MVSCQKGEVNKRYLVKTELETPVLSLSKETHSVEIEQGVQKLFDWYKESLEA